MATNQPTKTCYNPKFAVNGETEPLRNENGMSGDRPLKSRLAARLATLLAVTLPCATEGQITSGVFAPGSTNYGKSYAEWFAAWAQWAASLEFIHHPLYDTADLSAGQSGPVWFLGDYLGAGDAPSTFPRDSVVPAGKALFVTIFYAYADNSGCPSNNLTESQLRAGAQNVMDQAHDVTFAIDGVEVQDVTTSYRFQTPAYTFVTPPNNNYLEAKEGESCYFDHSATLTPWTITGAVDDGFCVMIAPLPLGPHTIHYSHQFGNPTTGSEDTTYNVTVVDTNLGNARVFPPDSAPYGKTYSQWTAEKWKWFYSLPIDRNPLFDTADLSAGQSGDVWFLGSTYTSTTNGDGVLWGTAVRTGSIPDGKALYVPLIDKESGSAETNGTNYDQLFAHSQFIMDHATNLSFTIDGQPVQNLEHYRAQSPLFTWGPLTTNNVFRDPVKFPAGLTSQSVADGYYLMLTPLPVGAHTLHFTGGMVTSVVNGDPSDFESEFDITYNLAVTPASLSLVPQGSGLMISWPQTSTSYLLEETDSLSPAHWSPSGASMQSVGSSYQVAIPNSRTNRFFRLRKQ